MDIESHILEVVAPPTKFSWKHVVGVAVVVVVGGGDGVLVVIVIVVVFASQS